MAMLFAQGALAWPAAGPCVQDPSAQNLAARLKRSGPAARDRLADELAALGERARLLEALEFRWRAAIRDLLESNTVGRVEGLARARRELDERRTQALRTLLADEVEGAKALQKLRELWQSDEVVPLRGKPRAAVEELQWNRSRQAALAAELDAPEALPAWAFAIAPDVREITVRNIALDAEDGERFERARQAERSNVDRLFACSPGPRHPTEPELGAFERINELRTMLGLVPLVWSWTLRDSMPAAWIEDEAILVQSAREAARRAGYAGEIVGAACRGADSERAPCGCQGANRRWMLGRDAREAAIAHRDGRWLVLSGTEEPARLPVHGDR